MSERVGSTFQKATTVAAKVLFDLYFDVRPANSELFAETDTMRCRLIFFIIGCLASIATTVPLPNRELTSHNHVQTFNPNPYRYAKALLQEMLAAEL